MNKAEFIAELDSRIAVLTEDERRDILDEYEQHIDIKVMRGMSEEAAIADFGRMEELVADILEAYHVRADYADPKRERKGTDIRERLRNAGFFAGEKAGRKEDADVGGLRLKLVRSGGDAWRRIRSAFGSIAGFCKRAGQSGMNGIRALGRSAGKGARTVIVFLKKPFVRSRRPETKAIIPAEDAESGKRRGKRQMRSKSGFLAAGAIGAMFGACKEAALWCLKWFWNLFWFGAGTLFGFGSCVVIFLMGTLAVLLLLGYPLTGITIGWLGLTLCMASATVGCFSLIIGKKNGRRDAEDDSAFAEKADERELYLQATEGEEEKEKEEMSHA